jgi:hypothetical protein
MSEDIESSSHRAIGSSGDLVIETFGDLTIVRFSID